MNRPFFSIVIPTYNRAADLQRAISSILLQNFREFEIVVSNNNSIDNTEEVIKQFRSKKIVYLKNKTNIGAIRNLKKAIKFAKGKYVLLQGDDDFIIYSNSLQELYNLLKKNGYGFLRLNYLYFSSDRKRIFDYKNFNKDLYIAPKQKPENIVTFLTNTDFNFISGVIFKNYRNAYRDIIYSESGPWFRILFKNVQRYGAYFLAKHYIACAWARSSSSLYTLQKGELKIENYFKEVSKVVNEQYFKYFLDRELKSGIVLLPSAKLNTSLKNFFQVSKRILQLLPEYKHSPRFWLYFLLTLFAPKFILRVARSYKEEGHTNSAIPHTQKIMANMKLIDKLLK